VEIDESPEPRGSQPEPEHFVRMVAELARHTGKRTQLTQAQALGISDSSLSKYLRGESEPSEETLIAMLGRADVPEEQHVAYLAARNSAAVRRKSGAPNENLDSQHREKLTPPRASLGPSHPAPGRYHQRRMLRLVALAAIVGFGCALLIVGAVRLAHRSNAAPTSTSDECDHYEVTAKDLELRDANGAGTGKYYHHGDQLTVQQRNGPRGHTYWQVTGPGGLEGWILPNERYWRQIC
jgi:transcriptional regulator with XRE-family HTH domain